MTRIARISLTSAVWSLTCLLGALAVGDDQAVISNFQKHLDGLSIAPAVQAQAKSILAEDAQNLATQERITQALIVLYPDYRGAVEASDDDDLAAALEKLQPLASSEDRFLAADATFLLSRTLMNHERYEDALPLLEKLDGELVGATSQPDVVKYFLGQARAGMLDNAGAVDTWMTFLQDFPDAPERLRVSAWRQIQDLQNINDGTMNDVYQRMDFSRRRLANVESGDRTQTEQDKIVAMLAKMIKEQEKKECSSSSSKKNAQQNQQREQQAQNKPGESKSQSGGSSSNPNGKFVEKSYDTGNASPWSRLRDMSRDPANAAIKDKLPARYREIVERYNDAVNGNGGK